MRMNKVAWITLLFLALAVPGLVQAQTKATLWDGTQWKDLTQETKIAYIKGVGNLADYETAASAARTGVVCKALGEQWRTKTISQIVQEVDKYYQGNPQKLTTPVIEVVLRCCSGLSMPEPKTSGKK